MPPEWFGFLESMVRVLIISVVRAANIQSAK